MTGETRTDFAVGAGRYPAIGGFRYPSATLLVVGAGCAVVVGAAASFGMLAGLFALGAAALAVLVLLRPDIGALVLVTTAPVLSGLKRGLPVPGLRLSEALIGLIAPIVLATADRSRVRRWRAFDYLALAYAATTLLLGLFGLFARGESLTTHLMGILIGPLQFFLLYRAVIVALPGANQQRWVLRLVLIASVPASLLALAQQYHLFGVRGLIPHLTGVDIDNLPQGEGNGTRATGLFPHWQVLAGYEFWIIMLGVGAYLERGRVIAQWALVPIIGLAVAAMFTTSTMTVILGALVGIVALGLWYGHLARVGAIVAVGTAIAFLAFGPALQNRYHEQFGDKGRTRPAWVPATMDYRYRLWRDQFVPAMSGYWWTGYGPDLPPSIRFRYTESLYFTLLVRGGIPLIFIYAGLTYALLAAAIRARNDPHPTRRVVARMLAVALVLLVGMHWVEPYFTFAGLGPLLWITGALALGGVTVRVAARAPSSPRPRLPRTSPAPG